MLYEVITSQGLADIGTPLAAGPAGSTREIDVAAHALAHTKRRVLDRRNNVSSELVTENSRERQPGMLAVIGVQVRSADGARMHSDDDLACARRGVGDRRPAQITAGVKHHCFHLALEW